MPPTSKLLLPTLLIFGLAAALPQKLEQDPPSPECIAACSHAQDDCGKDGVVEDALCIAADEYCNQNCDTTKIGKRSPPGFCIDVGATYNTEGFVEAWVGQ